MNLSVLFIKENFKSEVLIRKNAYGSEEIVADYSGERFLRKIVKNGNQLYSKLRALKLACCPAIYFFGEEGSYVYVIEELLRGKNINNLLVGQEQVAKHEIYSIIYKLLAALFALHESGLYHGNIKASNIIITDNFKEVKFTEFRYSNKPADSCLLISEDIKAVLNISYRLATVEGSEDLKTIIKGRMGKSSYEYKDIKLLLRSLDNRVSI